MSIAPGTRLAAYEVLSLLGAGGMGEVYRARDTRLGRDVAIKVLPDSFAADPDRVARFTREARTLASLNHPGIGAIYGIEEHGTTRALVMELVEGEDLSQVIARGPLPVADALGIAREIADALEAAHGAGIIHRDLKPANIRVKPDGTVKVLDFGLAKAAETADSSGALANSPTLTARATQMGVILGTAAYMSPEQARGRAVDRRADIWALGAILYEMLSGRRAFPGEDISITLASVLKDEIDWTALPPSAPRALLRLLRRCLVKDPKSRLRDAGDVRLEIDEILSGTAGEPAGPASPAPARRRSVMWIAGTAVLLMAIVAAAAAVGWRLKPAAADVPLRKFSITAKDGASVSNASISPDGRSIAFLAGGKLWVRRLEALDAQEVPGAVEVNSIFWSPDSAMVGFQAKGQLWKVAATGGNTSPIARVPREFSVAGGGVWLPGDRIIFTTGGSGLMEVSARGGEPRLVLAPDAKTETDFHQVSALPDGKGLLFVPHAVNQPLKSIDIFDGSTRRTLFTIEDDGPIAFAMYSPSGHLLYVSGSSVWAVPFALDRSATTGPPFRIAASGGRPSIASDGTLAMVTGASEQENLEPAWVSAKGVYETIGRRGHPLAGLRVSPDGRHAAGAALTAPGMSDIWIIDLARRTERRLTYEPGVNADPVWSRDGTRIVYACAPGICSRPADGSGQPLVLVPAPAERPTLSPDNQTLLFSREQPVTTLDVFQVALGPAGTAAAAVGEPRPFVANERMQMLATVSPSGKHAAYWSTESGPPTIYITEFPSGRGKWQVGQGQMPRWSPKGDRLYFNLAGVLTAVDVSTTPGLTLSEPRTVLPRSSGIMLPAYGFDLSPDGSRFLVNRVAGPGSAAGVTVIQNWFAEFSAQVKPAS
jgi:hypothetical protein